MGIITTECGGTAFRPQNSNIVDALYHKV